MSSASSTPASIIVPVASTTLAEYTNSILMDHDRLPTMQPFTFGSETVNGHDLNGEFVYVCGNQFAAGTFQVVGDSGLFSLGFATLAVTPSIPDMGVDVFHPDGSSFTFTLKPFEQRSVFLAKGDYFRVFCTLPEEAESHTLDGLLSNFVITRLSKNVDYTHPISVVPT
jgi:hypothetical protein